MAKMSFNAAKLESIMLDNSDFVVKKKATAIKEAAREIYLEERVLEDHNKYAGSFKLRHDGPGRWYVVNTDPVAFWVEFGAHAGGKTHVLGYAPLRRAVDIVASYQ